MSLNKMLTREYEGKWFLTRGHRPAIVDRVFDEDSDVPQSPKVIVRTFLPENHGKHTEMYPYLVDLDGTAFPKRGPSSFDLIARLEDLG